MLFYSLQIALKSLKRSPYLTALLLAAIALGVGLSTTFAATRLAFVRNPLSHKDHTLFNVRLDSWDPHAPYPGDDPTAPPPMLTYRDATELMKSKIPMRQTTSFISALYVHPDPAISKPFRELIRMVNADFFPMFDAPFLYGGPWSKEADAAAEPVLVLSKAMNDKLFGGQDSVGKAVRLDDRDYRVVGVLDRWELGLRLYDLNKSPISPPEELYAPFNLLHPLKLRTAGNTVSWKPQDRPGFEGILSSEDVWVLLWVEFADPQTLPAYEDFLRAYVLEQKKGGRFLRPLNNRVSALPELIRDFNARSPQATTLFVVSLFFFALCSLNLVGILLGKFLARAPEVGVRRALGASRTDIFLQHIVECELVGIIGGAFGVGIAHLGVAILNNMMKQFFSRSDLFRLDMTTLYFALVLALASGLVAGLYPAWRICRIPPAAHLKTS